MTNGLEKHRANIQVSRLRPTQLTVGMLEVKRKRRRLRELEKRPGELVAFILEVPIRVVLGPAGQAYVIDHHHLALALLKEDFQTAPMEIEADFSALRGAAFWKRMRVKKYLHLYNARGNPKPLSALPESLKRLKDDPYRSLAGFVRAAGGFVKTPAPFAEFLWADYFRVRIDREWMRADFAQAVKTGLRLAARKEAAGLPGYVGKGR